jgi:CRISPR-associated protein (TIGR03984 family)
MKAANPADLVRQLSVPKDFAGGLHAWLYAQATEHNLPWLLAYADDGVIWGKYGETGWTLSSHEFPEISPLLRPETLQQVRIFGETGECLLWRTDVGWSARLLQDEGEVDAIAAEYLLWGTDLAEAGPKAKNGLVQLSEGAEGLRHAPPLPGALPADRVRLALAVRHYVRYDEEDGAACIVMSRLVRLNYYLRPAAAVKGAD